MGEIVSHFRELWRSDILYNVCNHAWTIREKLSGSSVLEPVEVGIAQDGIRRVYKFSPQILNKILSFTGTQEAVLAAGPKRLRRWGAEEVAIWLLANTGHVRKALQQAAKHDLPLVVRYLLHYSNGKRAANIGYVLADAILTGHAHVVHELISKQPSQLDIASLHDAVLADHVDKVSELMTGPNVRPEDVQSALMLAAEHGKKHVVQLLLEDHDKYCITADVQSNNALFLAAFNGHVKVVRELLSPLQHAARADACNSCALMLAAMRGHVKVVEELLNRDKRCHAARADAQESAALVLAACKGYQNVVRILLTQTKHPARVMARDSAALIAAISQGHVSVVSILLHYYPGATLPGRVLDAANNCESNQMKRLITDAKRKLKARPEDLCNVRFDSPALLMMALSLVLLCTLAALAAHTMDVSIRSPSLLFTLLL